MSASRHAPRRPFRRSPLALAVIAVVGLAALGAAGGLAYLFLRAAPPPAVGSATASPGSSEPVASPGAVASIPVGTIGPEGLDGTWTLDLSIGSFSDFTSTFVGYRVKETLANFGANTAVGRTHNVTGSLVLAGSALTSVDVTADLSKLRSDDDRRDGRLREQAIETDRFPLAMFKLTTPIELGSSPVDGQAIDAMATGELRLHGVTRVVTIPVQAHLTGDVVTVNGSIDIRFADYGIDKPTSFLVVSIEDHGVLEFQLHFRRG